MVSTAPVTLRRIIRTREASRAPTPRLHRYVFSRTDTHILVIEGVQRYLGEVSLAADLAAVALTILAGAISWEVLEKPVGNLKRSFLYRDSDSRLD